MAKHPPAYQYYPSDFDASTRHWTPAEVGCYQRLLNFEWINGGLPPDRLHRIAGADREDWPAIWETLSPKFETEDGRLVNRRLENVRAEQIAYREERARSGRKGGLAKAQLVAQLRQSQERASSSAGSSAPSKKVALQSSSSSSSSDPSTNEPPCSPGANGRGDEFLEFWTAYPRKQKKADAAKAWKTTAKTRPPLPVLLAAVETQKRSRQWQKDGGQFIPLPATWLRGGSWDDEGVDPLPRSDEIDWSKEAGA